MPHALTLANDLTQLERLQAWVESLGDELGLTPQQVFHLNLALEEVVTNVMKYAYGPGVDLPIGLLCRVGRTRVEIQVEDQGPEFNPLATPPPDPGLPLEQRKVGGVGIYLAEQVMDELSYARRGGRNVLTIALSRDDKPANQEAEGRDHGDH